MKERFLVTIAYPSVRRNVGGDSAGMPDGLMYISLDEGFPVDRAARKMVLGASPEGGVLP
jgi:hypothetical protein